MPLVRLELKNEYGLGNPGLHRVTERDGPKKLLEGVTAAGLVGILRQLADLAEFASEVFHDLHEQMLETTSRSQDMIIRVQQLEDVLPSFQEVVLINTDHIEFAYTAGSDWHASLQTEENHVTRGDMPGFIMHACGPPRLSLLDKYDASGGGACLKRYSDPSFFKVKWASTELMKAEKVKKELKRLRSKRKMGNQRNGGTLEAGPLTRNNYLTDDASGFDVTIPIKEDTSTYSVDSIVDTVITSQPFNSSSKVKEMSISGNIEVNSLTNSISKLPCSSVQASVISRDMSLTGDDVHHGGVVNADEGESHTRLRLESDNVDALNSMESEREPDYDCMLKQEKGCLCAGEEADIRCRNNNKELPFISSNCVGNLSVKNEDFIHLPAIKNPRSSPSRDTSATTIISQDYEIADKTFSSSAVDGDVAYPSADNKTMKRSDTHSTESIICLQETNDFTEESPAYQQFLEHSSHSHDYESFSGGFVPSYTVRRAVRKQDGGEISDGVYEDTASTSSLPMKQISELDSSNYMISPESHHSDCSSPSFENMNISFRSVNDLDGSILNPDLPDVHDLDKSVTLKGIESEIESDGDTFEKRSLYFSEDLLSQEWDSDSERWECNQVNGHHNDVPDNSHRNPSSNSISLTSLIEETSRQVIGLHSSHDNNGEIRHSHSKSRKSSTAGSVDLTTNSTTSSLRLEETSIRPVSADTQNEPNVTGRYNLIKYRKSSAGSVDYSANRFFDTLGFEETRRKSVSSEYPYQAIDAERCNRSRSRKCSTSGSADFLVNSFSSPLEFEETSDHLLERKHSYQVQGAKGFTLSRSRKNSTTGSVDPISSSLGLEERSEHVESGCLNKIKDEQRNCHTKSENNSTDVPINLSDDLVSSSSSLVETIDLPIKQEFPYEENKDASKQNHLKPQSSPPRDLSFEPVCPSVELVEMSMKVAQPECLNEVKKTPAYHHSRSYKSSLTGSTDPSDYGYKKQFSHEDNKDASKMNRSKSRTSTSTDLSVEPVFPSLEFEEMSMQLVGPDCLNEAKKTPVYHHSRSCKSLLTGSADHSAHGIQLFQNYLKANVLDGNQQTNNDAEDPALLPPPLPKHSPISGSLQQQESHLLVNPPPDDAEFIALDGNKTFLRKKSTNKNPAVQRSDDRDSILEQIRTHSFCLRRTDTNPRPNFFLSRTTTTNIKVAAILEKAIAIRQACAGSDDDGDKDEENWSDD